MSLILATLLGCGWSQPDWCRARDDDADCDGVPDALDRCEATPGGAPTDRLGCSSSQAAGCSVELLEPADRAALTSPARMRWRGDCDVYLVQLSDDPSFPAGATRTATRTSSSEISIDGSETYWRVVGGLKGASAGFEAPARELRWE